MAALKRILIGRPISSADEHHQRLSKKIALPVFASDAISSTAYATAVEDGNELIADAD